MQNRPWQNDIQVNNVKIRLMRETEKVCKLMRDTEREQEGGRDKERETERGK